MYDLEIELNSLYEKMCDCTEEEMQQYLEESGEIQSELEASGFYTLDSKIEEVAFGLGLKEQEGQRHYQKRNLLRHHER